MAKTIGDAQVDATMLHALAQGASELFDGSWSKATPATNALCALLAVIVEKADALANDLDVMETEARHAPKPSASAGAIQ